MKILIIGDSHVDSTSFGIELEKILKAKNHNATRLGVGATSTKSWMSDPVCRPDKSKCVKLSDYLNKKYDLLLISLGTNDSANMAAGKHNFDEYSKNVVSRIENISNKINADKTIWIGPPSLRGNVKWYNNENSNIIYEAAKNCKIPIFDSRPSTYEFVNNGSGDGVHPGQKCGKFWAESLVKFIEDSDKKQPSKSSSTIFKASGIIIGIIVLFAILDKRNKHLSNT